MFAVVRPFRCSRRTIAGAFAAALLAACAGHAVPGGAAPPPPGPDAFRFALMGDMPYGPAEVPKVDRLIEDINRHDEVRFVLHVGDLKGGGESCDDALLGERLAQLQRLRPALVYTPGDNEWTDCHRRRAGGFQPLERLAALRRLFFPQPGRSLGQRPMPLQSQASQPGRERFVENAMWSMGGVVFATLHVVGSNNDLDPWHGLPGDDSVSKPRIDRIAEFREREAAVLAWVDETFARAKREDAAGVLLAMQANPEWSKPADHADRQGFNALLDAVARHARAFGKPVVVAHGDTHRQRVDKPLRVPAVPGGEPRTVDNVTRAEGFGSPFVHWVEVTVDRGDPQVFRFERRMVNENLF